MNIDCPICKITIVIEANSKGEYHHDNPHDPMDGFLYNVIQCPECFKPILTQRSRIFELGAFDFGKAIRLFPNSEFHINSEIPEVLGNALRECIVCYEAGGYTATAVMSRRAIEGFCELKSVKEKSLDKSLVKLKDSGIINQELFEWANALRLTGNKAAHDIKSTFSATDAKDILDFTIAILDFTYSYKDKFDKFISRHTR